MDKLKFTLFAIVVLGLMGLLGYWSVTTLQSGSEYSSSQKIKELQKENEQLKNEMAERRDEPEIKAETPAPAEIEPVVVKETPKPAPATPTVSTYAILIGELQKLVDEKVTMKQKSMGTRVGTVQKFLNIYNNTNNRIDNDYGASTKTAVAAFQKAQGLPASGEASSVTFNSMIDWLEAND